MGVIDGAKAVADLARHYDKLDLYRQAVELMDQVTQLAAENFELKQQVANLKRELELKGTIVFDKSAYYIADGDKRDGPYCTNCYDTRKILVRYLIREQKYPVCPNCKNVIHPHVNQSAEHG